MRAGQYITGRKPTRNELERLLIVTKTPSVEGQTVEKYLGIVSGEAILCANIFKDIFAGVRDIVGGRL